MTVNNLEIPPNATVRQEYVKCGNPDCQNSHGPYFYAYWKQDKKLKKRYVGKNLEDFGLRKIVKEVKLKPSLLIIYNSKYNINNSTAGLNSFRSSAVIFTDSHSLGVKS